MDGGSHGRERRELRNATPAAEKKLARGGVGNGCGGEEKRGRRIRHGSFGTRVEETKRLELFDMAHKEASRSVRQIRRK